MVGIGCASFDLAAVSAGHTHTSPPRKYRSTNQTGEPLNDGSAMFNRKIIFWIEKFVLLESVLVS